ncbi:ABC transporter permease [Primorskyibacter flagellatus]|uniref:ABC transporter permease n=1 Tax=Primorskyibacter flagellatus TaxID=1387277 RepID=UPI001F2F0078|nr:ABC transporter permease [Primorskyibacter flagellatus]
MAKSAGFGSVVGVALMLTAFTLIDFSGWWTARTISNVVHFSSILALIAMGQALVIISKEIDLSVGSVYGLTGIAFITFEHSLGVPGAVIAALAIAAVCGLLQGLAVVRGGLPSMIVTLGGLFTFRGIIYVWTGGSVRNFSEAARENWLTKLFGGEVFGIEAAVLWMLLMLAILSVVLKFTRFGNHLLATGGASDSAESRGVRIDRVKIITFVMCSVMAGFAGIVTLADQPQTHVTIGDLLELEAISAAVIGGCLLSGGRGSLIGAVLGAFIVTSFRYELIALGAPSSWFITFVGVVLIVAIIFNQKLARWAGHNV